jgi:hypothetical protein
MPKHRILNLAVAQKAVMWSTSRYIKMAIAVTAGVALALTSVSAASASPSQAGSSVYARAATDTRQVPLGVPPGMKAEQPIIFHVNADTSGVIGYAICLYNSQNNCISDTANDATDTPSIGVILSTVGDGITIYTVLKKTGQVGAAIYKYVKKYFYKGKHIYTGKGDGFCMGDFGYDQDVVLASCSESHGIYWEITSKSAFWNTYAKGDLIASSLTTGTHLFIHSPEDWVTWGFRELCENSC